MTLTNEDIPLEPLVPSAHEALTVVDTSAGIDRQTSLANGHQFRSSSAHPPAKQRSRRRSWQAAIFGTMFVLLLLIGGSLTYLYAVQKGPSIANGPQTKASISQPQSPLITATPIVTATRTMQLYLPVPAIPVGKLLYGTPLPGYSCDTTLSSWSKIATARITCTTSATELATTDPHQLAATFLGALPDGQGVPNDYILQVQLRQGPHSQGAFGVLFRNQAGSSVLGAYSLLLSSNGNWSSNVYDNITKKAMQLYTQRTTAQLHGVVTIDIRVQKDTFLLYIDGHQQGNIVSPFYTSGTVGLAVDTGADVFFSNFALYALPNK